jgi:hypothetical protein
VSQGARCGVLGVEMARMGEPEARAEPAVLTLERGAPGLSGPKEALAVSVEWKRSNGGMGGHTKPRRVYSLAGGHGACLPHTAS